MIKTDYDPEFDTLYIFKKGERVKFSIELFGSFVMDISFDNKVVGLEILNASKVLNVSKKELRSVKAAKLATLIKGNLFGAIYGIKSEKIEIESRIVVPSTRMAVLK
ncbi:MAG: hypothetical protein DRN20_06855 [Thermoplasmata archaeon]|nr:MAG: hypothetical protein DRN20_06855 [Thermoplasmata archaeon]